MKDDNEEFQDEVDLPDSKTEPGYYLIKNCQLHLPPFPGQRQSGQGLTA